MCGDYVMFEMFVLLWNVVVLLCYGLDKLLAKAKKWRISEQVLLLCAFLLGGLGALMGMVLFHHKTAKMKFRILVPLAMILNGVALGFFKRGEWF